jgi:hypothetical protein
LWNQICSNGVNDDDDESFGCHPPTMLIRQHVDWIIGDRRTWVYSHKIWNLTSLVIDAKTSRLTSWEVVLSPSHAQRKRWIPIGSKGWSQMQCDKLRFKGWGKPHWMRNILKKTSKVNRKRITRWIDNQAPTPGPKQDCRCTQCESKGKPKMMLEKEW